MHTYRFVHGPHELADVAHGLLRHHPALAGRRTECHFENECLVLTGGVPTWHQKQMAQEALRHLGLPLLNRIRVLGEATRAGV